MAVLNEVTAVGSRSQIKHTSVLAGYFNEIKNPDKLDLNRRVEQINYSNSLSNMNLADLDKYVAKTKISGAGDDSKNNAQSDIKEPVPEVVTTDDSLIPPINYTDPVIKHDPTLSMEPIVLPYTPEEAYNINEKGEINTYENFDATKVDAIAYPLIEVSNKVLNREHLKSVVLSYRNITPELNLVIYDIGDFAKRSDIFGMNSEIKLVIIPPVNNAYRPIRLLFQITNATFANDLIYITGSYKLCSMKESVIRDITFPECKKCKHPENKKTSTWEFLHELAMRTGLGFSCTEQCESIHDNNQRFLSGKNYLQFMQEEIEKGGLNEDSLFDVWVDLYNYIVMVNLPYIFNSDITYRHLSIRAITGIHSTAVGLPTKKTEHIKVVHRVLTNNWLTAEPNNLQIDYFDVLVDNYVVENGNLDHVSMYIPRGVGSKKDNTKVTVTPDDDTNSKDTKKILQEHNSITDTTKVGCNHVEQVDIQVAQNSKDGKHLSDYNQTHTSKLMIIRDDTNTKLQKKLRSAFLSKHRQRIYVVKLVKMNLDIQRGTIVEVRWFEQNHDAKQQAQHSPDNVLGQQSILKEPVEYTTVTNREAITDVSIPILNHGNSGQFYVDGMEFVYEETAGEIHQYLYLIKKGITDNLTNKYTSPRIDPDAFEPKVPTGKTDPDTVLKVDVAFAPLY